MDITGRSFIGGDRRAAGTVRYTTFNPLANKANPWQFTEAVRTEVDTAVDKAWDAFRVYRDLPGTRRAAFLRRIADEIEALGDALLDVYAAESGLPRNRAIKERARTLFQLRSFAALVETHDWKRISVDAGDPARKPAPKPDLRQTVLPLGPVAVFGASNFPFAYSTAGGDTASALAAGCPVVVKSHPMHAGTGEVVAAAVVRAAHATGMPDGVFSNLNSLGHDVGQWLVAHPRIKAVGFTGSIRGGRAMFDIAAKRPEPIPVFAEMGSINPIIFTPAALRARGVAWVPQLAQSLTLNSGQFCTNPGLILAPEGEDLEGFVEAFTREVVAVEPTCMLHPGIRAAYEAGKRGVLGEKGVAVVGAKAQGEVLPNHSAQVVARAKGADFLLNPRLREEVFGPFCVVVSYAGEAELLAILEGLEGQLTGTVLFDEGDPADMNTVVPRIAGALRHRVGRVVFNGVPTGVEVCPSMLHGGPYPASTDPRFTAVGTRSIYRWARPVSYQNAPPGLLPDELRPAAHAKL